jgi:hypothetical protein
MSIWLHYGDTHGAELKLTVKYIDLPVLCHEIRHSLYTCEQVIRNVRSKPNQEVSVLFIRSRLRAINCCRFKLKTFFSLCGLWLVFVCYKTVSLKNAVYKGSVNLGFTSSFLLEDES